MGNCSPDQICLAFNGVIPSPLMEQNARDNQYQKRFVNGCKILDSYRKCVGAVQPRESISVSRRGICDRKIWRKPLAFAADAEVYEYIVWGFIGRFAILSPEPC